MEEQKINIKTITLEDYQHFRNIPNEKQSPNHEII